MDVADALSELLREISQFWLASPALNKNATLDSHLIFLPSKKSCIDVSRGTLVDVLRPVTETVWIRFYP